MVSLSMPYDGNCMFSAIAYQLNSTGVCDVDSAGLRQTTDTEPPTQV